MLLALTTTVLAYRCVHRSKAIRRCAPASMQQEPYSADLVDEQPDYTFISTTLLSQLLEVDQASCATPPLPTKLKNRYFALRHGQSESNLEGVISSDPAVGTTRHGLTAEGRLQARRAATKLLDVVGRENMGTLAFVSSDFTRAWQTADESLSAVQRIVEFEQQACEFDDTRPQEECALLATPDEGVVRTPLLRERWFGELDALPLKNYNQVWPRDLVSAAHDHCGVESVDKVCARVRELIMSLEAEREGQCIVLASHADTLQITQCYVAGADPRSFSMFRFKNGEVRELLRTPASLPPPVPLTYA
jgi:broad specificity phosphatase PhoE|eukprot:Transcript_28385.p1 GENE.Transcript_28385~~Transcript_28385.p1  ORF type:complete len:327 (+),score=89.39 Transcript_28385:66-983(+)